MKSEFLIPRRVFDPSLYRIGGPPRFTPDGPNDDGLREIISISDHFIKIAAVRRADIIEHEMRRCLSEWVSEIEPVAYWRDGQFIGIGCDGFGPIIRAHPIEVRIKT
jgi:hypothetical protein